MWKRRTEPNETTRKPVNELTPSDLVAFPVWEYANDEEELPGRDETWVRPVQSLPVSDLSNRVAGVPVHLASGETLLAAMSNIELEDPSDNEHFLVIGLYRPDGEQFVLARYHDHHRDVHGPQQLAEFLGLPLKDIFPISYDLTSIAVGKSASLRGTVEAQPRNPQSRRDLMKRALQRHRP
jgi:hypothetical protein